MYTTDALVDMLVGVKHLLPWPTGGIVLAFHALCGEWLARGTLCAANASASASSAACRSSTALWEASQASACGKQAQESPGSPKTLVAGRQAGSTRRAPAAPEQRINRLLRFNNGLRRVLISHLWNSHGH